MPIELDEYPIHQAPLSLEFPVSSDRNFYDRCYFNAHDRTGSVMLVTGLGIYPNLGVIDAYATVRLGDRQHSIHISDALGTDRMQQMVGPYRIEVIEPLKRIRLVCDGDTYGVGFDLTWNGSFPAVQEQPHVLRVGGKVILDACRFAQVGTWTGQLRVDSQTFEVTPDRWVGTRDRSWGIRPVGEPEPPGRAASESPPDYGFWWTYIPLRFEDFAIVLIAQQDSHGHRSLNDAVRVWPAGSGRDPEQLGWPTYHIRYQPGTRHPVGATIELTDVQGGAMTLECETLGHVALNCGAGYGGDPDWQHGSWKGRDFIEQLIVDLADPATAGRIPFGVLDHVGKATLSDSSGNHHQGWGLFEHACIGTYLPAGFTDFGSVAT